MILIVLPLVTPSTAGFDFSLHVLFELEHFAGKISRPSGFRNKVLSEKTHKFPKKNGTIGIQSKVLRYIFILNERVTSRE